MTTENQELDAPAFTPVSAGKGKVMALVLPDGRIAQLEKESFPVHADFSWHEVSDDTATQDTFRDGKIIKFRPFVSLPTIDNIKAEAARRILQIAPDWKQRNMAARRSELAIKSVQDDALTTDEAAELDAISVLYAAIDGIRSKSNDLEKRVTAGEDFDVLADKEWQ